MRKLAALFFLFISFSSMASEFKIVCASASSLDGETSVIVSNSINSQIKDLGSAVINVSAPTTKVDIIEGEVLRFACVTVTIR